MALCLDLICWLLKVLSSVKKLACGVVVESVEKKTFSKAPVLSRPTVLRHALFMLLNINLVMTYFMYSHLWDCMVPIFICARYLFLLPPVQDKPHTQFPRTFKRLYIIATTLENLRWYMNTYSDVTFM